MHKLKGYAIGHMCVYVCVHNYNMSQISAVWCLAGQKMSRKLLKFPFALRHRECDSQLPVHSMLSAIPVSLLVFVGSLGASRSGIR